jgi:hypothetical protein
LRLLVQFLPDLVAVAAIVKQHVTKPKGSQQKHQKANNPHLNLLPRPHDMVVLRIAFAAYVSPRDRIRSVLDFTRQISAGMNACPRSIAGRLDRSIKLLCRRQARNTERVHQKSHKKANRNVATGRCKSNHGTGNITLARYPVATARR